MNDKRRFELEDSLEMATLAMRLRAAARHEDWEGVAKVIQSLEGDSLHGELWYVLSDATDMNRIAKKTRERREDKIVEFAGGIRLRRYQAELKWLAEVILDCFDDDEIRDARNFYDLPEFDQRLDEVLDTADYCNVYDLQIDALQFGEGGEETINDLGLDTDQIGGGNYSSIASAHVRAGVLEALSDLFDERQKQLEEEEDDEEEEEDDTE